MQPRADSRPIVLTVSELTQAIKMQLEHTFPLIVLKGEISNLKLQSSGHLYFSLKDENAQISCVMFRQEVLHVQVPLKVGDQVVVYAKLTVFPPKGNYQLVVQEISLLGIGELLLRLEQLKQKLQARGWFDQARKKALPPFPKRIGVVTSPTGAVIRDIIHVLSRRLKKFHLILNPVRVQGDGAADEIAKAIEQFNQYNLVDVMIVGRGGGSLEDLMPFNDEKVAEAIFKSTIPVISAVGHETDISIADFVADVRAPTPSAAAEILSFEMDELLITLAKYQRQIQHEVRKRLETCRQNLARALRHPLFTSPSYLLGPTMQRLDDLKEDLDQALQRLVEQKKQALANRSKNLSQLQPMRTIQENKNKLNTLSRPLDSIVQREIQRKKEKLNTLAYHLASVNPKALLSKGYSICFSQKDGSVIKSTAQVRLGDELAILLSDGKLNAQITNSNAHDKL